MVCLESRDDEAKGNGAGRGEDEKLYAQTFF